jgi:hypothetical protein
MDLHSCLANFRMSWDLSAHASVIAHVIRPLPASERSCMSATSSPLYAPACTRSSPFNSSNRLDCFVLGHPIGEAARCEIIILRVNYVGANSIEL